jgi:hypothetical protein
MAPSGDPPDAYGGAAGHEPVAVVHTLERSRVEK